MGDSTVRSAEASDAGFLRLVLYEAATWRQDPASRPPVDDVLSDPRISRYVDAWPRPRDAGFVASRDGRLVGAAWYRFLPEEVPGYGFVAASVPELTIAVVPDARGLGIGSALVEALLAEARRLRLPGVSLSVEADNPALRLYEGAGFERVALAGGAWTMLARLDE
jgi:ribosomal protein S18 acetylase RimI-like enzyme